MNDYESAVKDYVDWVRVLFSSPGVPAGERGGKGPVSYKNLADQAEKLLPISKAVTDRANPQLYDPNTEFQIQASTGLLAKALIDLEISSFLFSYAEDEMNEVSWSKEDGTQRSVGKSDIVEDYLNILSRKTNTLAYLERGLIKPQKIEEARKKLLIQIDNTLDNILDKAKKSGGFAFKGLCTLGITNIFSAGEILIKSVGTTNLSITQLFCLSDKITRLHILFRDYALQAFDSLQTLLGSQLIKIAVDKVLEWMKGIDPEKHIERLLNELYEIEQTKEELKQKVLKSHDKLDKFVMAINNLDNLDSAYMEQIRLAEKLLKGFKSLGGLVTLLPNCTLIVAAVYIILEGYIVFSGADFVDSKYFKPLDRIPGVRSIINSTFS